MAEPVSANGVFAGIVKPPGGTVGTGAPLVVGVMAAQLLPPPDWVKLAISSKFTEWK